MINRDINNCLVSREHTRIENKEKSVEENNYKSIVQYYTKKGRFEFLARDDKNQLEKEKLESSKIKKRFFR